MDEARRRRILRQHVATDALLGVEAVPIAPGVAAGGDSQRERGGEAGPSRGASSRETPRPDIGQAAAAPPAAKPAPSPNAAPSPDAGAPPPRTVVPIDGDKAERLEAIRLDHEQNCETPLRALQAPGAKVVFGEGDPDADLMFVGEGPGETEARLGRPFVGRAGELLDKMIVAMGLTRETVYIANAVKFRPPNNRAPTPEEVAAELPYLEDQIATIDPKVIVTLGGSATKTLLQTRRGIMSIRGQWQEYAVLATGQRIPVMPTYHPAFLLRQYTPDNRKRVWADLQQAMKRLAD